MIFLKINYKNNSKFNIFHILGLKIVKSSPSRAFQQQYQEWAPISLISVLKFQWHFFSIFNNSYTIGVNIMNPPWYTCTDGGFSNHSKSTTRGFVVWEISTWQNKTNTRPSLIVVCLNYLWAFHSFHNIILSSTYWPNTTYP